MKKKIAGLAPSWRHRKAGHEQPDLPDDYEASVLEVVGKIKQSRQSPDSTRQLSKEELFRMQVKRLYSALDGEDIPASLGTIDAMGITMNVDAADLLAILLEYPDETVRAHAALALGQLCQRAAVIPLIKALDDKSAQVSENAATALGMIGDNRAEIPLQKVPVDNPRVKRAAVNALARIESKRI
ncbi:MAG: HEAT repeat domain-containing protein [Methanocella sp.]